MRGGGRISRQREGQWGGGAREPVLERFGIVTHCVNFPVRYSKDYLCNYTNRLIPRQLGNPLKTNGMNFMKAKCPKCWFGTLKRNENTNGHVVDSSCIDMRQSLTSQDQAMVIAERFIGVPMINIVWHEHAVMSFAICTLVSKVSKRDLGLVKN